MAGLFDIFKKAASKNAYKDLDEGKKIKVKMRSDRYTYENQEDNNYDKDWKPETEEERKTLSPEGYFRKDEEEDVKEEIGINKDNEDLYNKKQISIPSTALNTIEYDPDTELLSVTFQSGKTVYDYPGVPLELVQALMKAPSKGEFFMNNIHDQYSLYRKNHSAKTRKDRRAIKKYIKSFVKTNKGKWNA